MGFSRRRALMLAGALIGAGALAAALLLETAPAPAPPDITAAPTQIAHTALGTVGYREVGHGPTLCWLGGPSAVAQMLSWRCSCSRSARLSVASMRCSTAATAEEAVLRRVRPSAVSA
jgi:hypothetical protein